mmetsp:Transcript_1263/g.2967  ORF Transcript_1263/g.2967 Transcript_1263/m.2967 type:complete len:282 (+) Transcript_1263:231-1076(+)
MRLQSLDFSASIRTPKDELSTVMGTGNEVVSPAPSDLNCRRRQFGDDKELLNGLAVETPDCQSWWVRSKSIVGRHEALADVRSIHTRSCSSPLDTAHDAGKLDSRKLPRGPCLPHDDETVGPAGHQPPRIEGSTTRPNRSVVAFVAAEKRPLWEAPNTHHLVLTAREQQVVLSVEGDECHWTLMALQSGPSGIPRLFAHRCNGWTVRCSRIFVLGGPLELQRLTIFSWLPHLFGLRNLFYDGIKISWVRIGCNTFSLSGRSCVRIPSRLHPRHRAGAAARP